MECTTLNGTVGFNHVKVGLPEWMSITTGELCITANAIGLVLNQTPVDLVHIQLMDTKRGEGFTHCITCQGNHLNGDRVEIVWIFDSQVLCITKETLFDGPLDDFTAIGTS